MSILSKEFESAVLDLYVDQGDDFAKSVTLSNSSNVGLEFDGFTFSGYVSRYYNTNKRYPLIVEPGAEGKLIIKMPSAETSKLTSPRYVYTILATSTSETVRVMQGQVLVSNS